MRSDNESKEEASGVNHSYPHNNILSPSQISAKHLEAPRRKKPEAMDSNVGFLLHELKSVASCQGD